MLGSLGEDMEVVREGLEETPGARYPQQVQQNTREGVRLEGERGCSPSPHIFTQENP